MRRLAALWSRRAIGPLLVVAVVFVFVAVRVIAMLRFETADAITLAVVFDADESRAAPSILVAYDRALTEEGIPHTLVSQTGQLLLLPGSDLARRFPAMILADGINRRASQAFARRMQEYVAAGGSLAIISDVASEDRLGHYLGHGRLIDLAGIDYVRYGVLGSNSYVTGAIAFRDAATARSWNVPAGKLNGSVLSSSTYGRLRYPLPASRVISSDVDVIAADGPIPVLTVRRIGPSTIVFTGLPLGYLEAGGDALPLRFMLRTFTRRLVPIPRLVSQGASFMQRVATTTIEFRRASRTLVVHARNPAGLSGIGFAIPQGRLAGGPAPAGTRDRGTHDGFRFFSIASDARELSLRFEATTK